MSRDRKKRRPTDAVMTDAPVTNESTAVFSSEGLSRCTEDARMAALDRDTGPDDPTDFHDLRGRLTAARAKVPPLYIGEVYEPYVNALDQLGPAGFHQVLLQDPAREGGAGLMLDIAQAILQNGEGYAERQTDAFQEVISDLYDGFLSAEDRVGVEPPDRGVTPPLAKWGRPDFGPYTFPVDATEIFGCHAAVVSLPPANTRQGLLAWAALPHETAGHDILSADTGLRGQLIQAVRGALRDANMPFLARYWSSRIDETAADVMGMLNMGPAAGIGLIGFFRGLNAAFGGDPQLRNDGPANDPHPADILRGFLAASTVRLLEFQQASAWGDFIEQETRNDLGEIRLSGRKISADEGRDSAQIVAQAIVETAAPALENHSLLEIQNWRDADEDIARRLGLALTRAGCLPSQLEAGAYAAHAVAAAVYVALQGECEIASIFSRMVDILKLMHDRNPSWGPLFVRHPGSVAAHRAYEVGGEAAYATSGSRYARAGK